MAEYLPPMQEEETCVDFCELSPELTRPFRGLRVWLPMKLHGLSVFRRYLDEKLDLARWIQGKIEEIPQLEILAPADLSILAFAVADSGESLETRNVQTRQLHQRINQKNRVHLTATTVKDIYAIRIAISSYRTHLDRVEMLLEDIVEALALSPLRASSSQSLPVSPPGSPSLSSSGPSPQLSPGSSSGSSSLSSSGPSPHTSSLSSSPT